MDVNSKRPATPGTRFAIASSTKPVTAALVLDLVERRKLSLGTKLSRLDRKLPGAARITVRMLLNHTSGLNEYFDDPQINQTIVADPDHHWRRGEVLRGVTKTLFAPGTEYSYSNSAYVVLGGLIEKVTGNTIEHAFRKRIADRLNLSNSTFTYRRKRSYLFAHPYVREVGGLQDAFAPGIGVPSDYWGPVWTDGGLASTSPDLARFGDALFRGRILKPKTVKEMVRRIDSAAAWESMSRATPDARGSAITAATAAMRASCWYDRTRAVTIAVNTNAQISSLVTWQTVVAAYDHASPNPRPCRAAQR